jgi:Plasmid pRiA4b ORF-3-like protein
MPGSVHRNRADVPREKIDVSDLDGAAQMGHLDETQFRLTDLVAGTDRIDYDYDFGDGWDHALVVEARAAAQDGACYPACIAGEGACPPEDCAAALVSPSSRKPSRGRRATRATRWCGGRAATTTPITSTCRLLTPPWRRPAKPLDGRGQRAVGYFGGSSRESGDG